jgi:hypothetical protein
LLPFEDTIVPDGWLQPDPLGLAVLDILGTDVDAACEEATHRYEIAESLPPGGPADRSHAERLRFYTKNQQNRERFADEIATLKDETAELNRIYHQQLGKAQARALGREFRDLSLRSRVRTRRPTGRMVVEVTPVGRTDCYCQFAGSDRPRRSVSSP